MKKRISTEKVIALFSFVFILFLGFYFLKSSADGSFQNSNVFHTYLVKIPNDAGICPYELMSKTNGKLKMVGSSHSICPYAEHAFYMTARSKDKNSVRAMLPSSVQKKVEIINIDNFKKPHKNNKFSKSFASVNF